MPMFLGHLKAPSTSERVNTIAIPDGISPKVAWRMWRIAGSPPEVSLMSLTQSCIWPAGKPLHASCGPDPDAARRYFKEHGVVLPAGFEMKSPVESCTCGIYAVNADSPELERYAQQSFSPVDIRVLGRVALWGTVVVGESGYRAEYAYPQALYVSDHMYTTVAPQLQRYNVPVMKWSAQTLVKPFGNPPFGVGAVVAPSFATGGLVPPPGAAATRRAASWTMRTLHALTSVVFIACIALQIDAAQRAIWWGATGVTWERLVLALLRVLLSAGFALIYVRLFVDIWFDRRRRLPW